MNNSRVQIGILTLALALFVPLGAYAESVLWSGTTGTMCYARSARPYPGCQIFKLSGVIQQVAYNVRVVNVETGAAIASGSTVPSGTHVRYEFVPHVSGDIYWFGSGGGIDSPNGDWNEGAAFIPEMCIPKNYLGKIGLDRNRRAWVNFIVDPPEKTVTGLPNGCTAAADGVSQNCVLTGPMTVAAQFRFAQTFGRYYTKFQNGDTAPNTMCSGTRGGDPQMTRGGNDPTPADDIVVPEQSVSHTITVEEGDGSPPSTPSLSSGGTCVIDEPHTISMSATDPDGDDIKYGIDWNADGSIDELVPPTGFVPSGTSQQASRTYATTGEKTVRVNATDEGGNTSPWATLTFNCNEGGSDDEDGDGTSCPLGYSLQNNTCVFSGCPSGYTLQGGTCVPPSPQCTPASYCVGNDLHQRNAQCQESFNQSCVFGCSGGGCIAAPSGQGNIIVKPALIRSGETTVVTWQTTDMVSCTVVENNPEISDTDNRENGSFTSSPIRQQTSYTLICTREDDSTFTDSATVNIIPVFEED